MSLTADERTWLRRYKAALDEQFPGLIEELLLYGSKARGDDHPESDLDILIITGDTDFKTQDSMRWVGYMLAAMSSALPLDHGVHPHRLGASEVYPPSAGAGG